MEDKMLKGKIYNVVHCRKGSFTVKVTHQDSEWMTGKLVEGNPTMLVAANEVSLGKGITLRNSFLTTISEVA